MDDVSPVVDGGHVTGDRPAEAWWTTTPSRSAGRATTLALSTMPVVERASTGADVHTGQGFST